MSPLRNPLHGVLSLALVGLTACAPEGAVRVIPLDDGDRVVLRAYDPSVVSCPDIAVSDLPTAAPLAEGETMAPEPGFADLDLPSEPLTLVAVQYDDCAVVGVGCVDGTPGVDAEIRIEPEVHCAPGCAAFPACPRGCCTFDAAGQVTSPDCDGDGLLNDQELDTDTDGDGVADVCDIDSDGDGLSDARECDGLGGPCVGLTGEPLYRDSDGDDDGVPDGLECCDWDDADVFEGCDIDGDGSPAHLDPDTDGDGIDDAEEALFAAPRCPDGDCDGDGLCNAVDLDSDGDGAADGRECSNPGLMAMCVAPWDESVVRCDEAVTERATYCGACCHPTARCEGDRGPGQNFCVPSDAAVDRPAWEMDGGIGAPGGTTGTILLQALVFDDTVDDRVARIPFEFSQMARDGGVFEAPEGAVPGESILEQLLVSQSRMSCLASGPDGPTSCLAVFGIRASRPDPMGIVCSINADIILVVADHFGDASSYASLTAEQQSIIGSFDRGYQFRRNEGSAGPWERQQTNAILLERPTDTASCRGADSQFDFE